MLKRTMVSERAAAWA
jgi:hypothetical protein